MLNLIKELERMNFRNDEICLEEGYLLVYKSINSYYYNSSFSMLRNNFCFEDLLDDVFEVCIRRDLFNRFELSKDFLEGRTDKNGKKAYVKKAVFRMLQDMQKIRGNKIALSLDKNIESDDDGSVNLYNSLASDVDVQEEVIGNINVRDFINSLDDSKGTAIGFSPLLGHSKLNEKTVLLHILEGYTPTEIASIYKNPDTGKEVTRTYISKLLRKCRRYF